MQDQSTSTQVSVSALQMLTHLTFSAQRVALVLSVPISCEMVKLLLRRLLTSVQMSVINNVLESARLPFKALTKSMVAASSGTVPSLIISPTLLLSTPHVG